MTETDTYIQFEIVNVESSTVVWNHRQAILTMVECVFVNKTNDDSVGGDGLPHQRI